MALAKDKTTEGDAALTAQVELITALRKNPNRPEIVEQLQSIFLEGVTRGLRSLPALAKADQEDAVQDTFERVWRKLMEEDTGGWSARGPLQAWIAAITRRTARNRWARAQREPAVGAVALVLRAPDDPDLLHNGNVVSAERLHGDGPALDSEVARQELYHGMSPLERQVWSFLEEGYSFQEIVERMRTKRSGESWNYYRVKQITQRLQQTYLLSGGPGKRMPQPRRRVRQ